MDKQPLVSVVVPIYNVEKYLERCVNSILNQTYKNLEVILVDDGSPDNSPALCDKFAEEDSRVKVIHKENGGLSSARNAGINSATGKYIGFVDSDDDIELDMYEKMLNVIQREKVDFVMADYARIPADGEKYLKTLNIRSGLYNKADIKKEIYPSLIMGGNVDYGPLLSVWQCMYNLEFLRRNNLSFDEEVKWSEDNIFSAIMGYCADSFYYMKGEGVYHYYQNSNSITTGYRSGAWDVYLTMNRHLKQFFADKDNGYFSNQLKLHLIYYACVSLGQVDRLNSKEMREDIKSIVNTPELREAFKNVEISGITNGLKIHLWFIKHRCWRILDFLKSRSK